MKLGVVVRTLSIRLQNGKWTCSIIFMDLWACAKYSWL